MSAVRTSHTKGATRRKLVTCGAAVFAGRDATQGGQKPRPTNVMLLVIAAMLWGTQLSLFQRPTAPARAALPEGDVKLIMIGYSQLPTFFPYLDEVLID